MGKYIPAEMGFAMDEAPAEFQSMDALNMQGIGFKAGALEQVMSYAEDAAPTVTGAGSVNNPWFYLNYLAKKPIQAVTQRTVLDEILGRNSEGAWANVSITQQFREFTGRTAPYDDFVESAAPRVNRAYSYESRDILRLSAGLIVTELESRQAAMIPGQYSPSQDKREAIALLFKLDREAIGHYGYRLGGAKIWGLLNDPNLGPFYQVAKGADSGETTWAGKTFHEIIADLMTAVASVQKHLKANFIPATSKFKIVIPVGCDQYLGKVPECGGKTVREWIKEQWKKCEIHVDPCFDEALGGENVFYVIVDEVGSSPVADQHVPASLFMVGSMQREAGRSELWSMATAGVFVKQPLGVGRFFGI